ncbi:MAG TPA: trimeric intracellular cation channel family protein [Stellaceae bacterium]|nr:trimeric intracellular cation channel family protein [Stellaceae bacterium]
MRDAPEKSSRLSYAADLAGTTVFAAEGALAAIGGHLDLFGVLVLGFATALGGGVARDVLIGAIPPQALKDWRYTAIALAAAALTFLLQSPAGKVPFWLIVGLDAAGLSLFAVAGTEKALAFGLSPFIATLLGTVTGVGGGTIRDVLLSQVPVILRVDIYATAALAGSVVLVGSRALGLPPKAAALAGGLTCFALRIMGVWQHWQLPGSSAS